MFDSALADSINTKPLPQHSYSVSFFSCPQGLELYLSYYFTLSASVHHLSAVLPASALGNILPTGVVMGSSKRREDFPLEIIVFKTLRVVLLF